RAQWSRSRAGSRLPDPCSSAWGRPSTPSAARWRRASTSTWQPMKEAEAEVMDLRLPQQGAALKELPSLPEVHRSVNVPTAGSWLRRFLAVAGPGYLVSVGYMDPGNWGTDLAGGAKFGYRLLWVILVSNLMAMLLQTLCARLGLVTGRDLAQACRDYYKRPACIALWLLCDIAIVACDLAEIIGSAVALNLLFH